MKNQDIIERVRRFNRFYVQFFGLYNNNLLESKFSLTEARVFFELGKREFSTSKEIVSALEIDTGYMSRMINKFEKNGYIKRESSSEDGRKQIISLTAKGAEIYNKLNKETNTHIKYILKELNDSQKKELKQNLDNIELLLK
jgi:DNA-binding MarR family transcriptional regulator